MKYFWYLLLLISGVTGLSVLQEFAEISLENHEEIFQWTKCVRHARRQTSRTQNPMVIITDMNISNFEIMVTTVNRGIVNREPVIIFNFLPNDLRAPLLRKPYFVIFSDSPQFLNTVFFQLERKIYKNSKYLIVTNLPVIWVEKFTDSIYNRGIRRVGVLHKNSNISTKFEHIVSCKFLLENPTEKLELQEYLDKLPRLLKYAKIFDPAEPKNDFFENKKNNSSLEANILRYYADRFSMKVEEVNNVTNWNNALEKLKNKKVDLIFQFLPVNVDDKVKIVSWYKFMTLCVVCRITPVPLFSSRLLKPFKPNVWICIVIIMTFFSIFSIVLNKLRNGAQSRDFIKLWTILTISMTQSSPRLPVKFGLRLCVGMLLLFIYFLSSTYNAVYSSHMTSPGGSILLKSFRDAIDSNRSIGGPAVLMKSTSDEYDPDVIEFLNRYNRSQMSLDESIKAMWDSDMIGILPHIVLQMYNWNNRANDSRRLYALTESRIITFPVFIYTRKGGSSDERIEDDFRWTIDLANSAGILDKFYVQNYFGKLSKTNLEGHENDEETIQLKHLDIAFKFHYYLLGVAFFIFILEIINGKIVIQWRN